MRGRERSTKTKRGEEGAYAISCESSFPARRGPAREGSQKTPLRVEKAMAFLTQGYKERLEDVVARGSSPRITTTW
jgi:GTP cyclohydrolase I